jgi:hypothetical protein
MFKTGSGSGNVNARLRRTAGFAITSSLGRPATSFAKGCGKVSKGKRLTTVTGKPFRIHPLHVRKLKGTTTNMNFAISEIKSQSIQQVEKAFIAKSPKQDVLFIKSEGKDPIAYQLPTGFLERLKASAKSNGLFPLGKTLLTGGAIEALEDAGQSANEFLSRHQQGDWGDVDEWDWGQNDSSARSDCRILSAYRTGNDVKLWVITEADRSATTVLLPSEY